MAKQVFTGGALNVTNLLTGLTGTALTKALAKIAAFEAKVEAGKSASIKIGADTFQFKKASGVQAVTFTNNGTSFDTAAALTTAATAPAPTPTTAPTPAPSATQALTSTNGETLFGTSGNDPFTATVTTATNAVDTTFQAADIIADSSSKDADTLTVSSATADLSTVTATVVGIENTVLNFTTFAAPTVAAGNIRAGNGTVN